MSNFIEHTIERARKNPKTIVLPEGSDDRVRQAAAGIVAKGVARIILLTEDDPRSAAKRAGADISGVQIVVPDEHPHLEEYAARLYELRKQKGLTLDQARELIRNPLYLAAMMVCEGEADAAVGGCAHSTSDWVRPLFQIIGPAKAISTVSSCTVMALPYPDFGENGLLLYSDAGVVPNPSAEQLAEIGLVAAESARIYLECEPRVAFLSFSTKGSAKHPDVEKVRKAVEIARKRAPQIVLDGELQGDAAVVPSVCKRKCPDSPVAGRANVLIFPDLDAGNIAYKLTQRLAKAEAYGPLLQGLAKPSFDLSRGADAEEIEGVIAIAVVAAGGS